MSETIYLSDQGSFGKSITICSEIPMAAYALEEGSNDWINDHRRITIEINDPHHFSCQLVLDRKQVGQLSMLLRKAAVKAI